jgi:hypothetical protein
MSRVICLSEDNPYHKWKVLAQRKLAGPERYTELTYLRPGCDVNRDSSLVRIASVVFLVTAAVGTCGFPCFSKTFRNYVRLAASGELYLTTLNLRKKIVTVYSKTSLEEHLWKQLKKCSFGKSLYKKTKEIQKKAFKSGAVTSRTISLQLLPYGRIRLFSKDKKPWPAQCNLRTGRISISLKEKEEKMLGSLLFEVINLFFQKKFRKIDKRAAEGKIKSANKYAKEVERIEYDTAKLHDVAIAFSVREGNWNKRMCKQLFNSETFQKDWKKVKKSAHAEDYRIIYREFYAKPANSLNLSQKTFYSIFH